MRARHYLSTTLAVAVLWLGAATVAAAQQQVSGNNLLAAVASEVSELPGGGSVQVNHFKGFNTTDDVNSPFHQTSQDCSGTYIITAEGMVASAAGYCSGLDPDGDTWWAWWHSTGIGGTWGFMGGTGKWANLEGGGTWSQVKQMPDGKVVNRWEGTYGM